MGESTLRTPITELLGIKYPILLAGMNVAAGPQLAAAVSNAGGLGVIGSPQLEPNPTQATAAGWLRQHGSTAARQ
jgi:NAD(P)H-dependent flavin oxidoreductase YrpB (nitropropane dioxygenase family)